MFDRVSGVTTGAPPRVGSVTLTRTTAQGMLTHYRRAVGVEHQWKIGGQLERGEHHAVNMVPTGVRFENRTGQPVQRVSSLPAHVGGVSLTSSAFATDTMTLHDRLTLTAGIRFDHSRAISQDLHALDLDGRNRRDTDWSRNDVHLERLVATAWSHREAERGRPHDPAGELRTICSGRFDRRA